MSNMTLLRMKSTLVVVILLGFANLGFTQVGFNNPNPDGSSILDLTAVDKGVLIPRLTSAQREAVSSPARSLLVFDTTEGKFYFYDGGQWYALNEWVKTSAGNDVSLNGNVNVTGSIAASGTVTASNYGLNSNGNGPVPAGGIIMWSGSITAIPFGWALCDGSSGTPDLRERFIVGAGTSDNITVINGGAYSQGSSGGQNLVGLSMSNIPSHTHTMASAGSHSHTVKGQWGGDNGDHSNDDAVGAGDKGRNENSFYFDHTSSIAGAHTHTINPTGGDGSGNAVAHENRPPYYALAFIMKLP